MASRCAREYEAAAQLGKAKKFKVPWNGEGKYFVWADREDLIDVLDAELDCAPEAGAKIGLRFKERKGPPGDERAVVGRAGAPREYRSRKECLRFALCYTAEPVARPRAPPPPEADARRARGPRRRARRALRGAGARGARATAPAAPAAPAPAAGGGDPELLRKLQLEQRLTQLERVLQAERLIHLETQLRASDAQKGVQSAAVQAQLIAQQGLLRELAERLAAHESELPGLAQQEHANLLLEQLSRKLEGVQREMRGAAPTVVYQPEQAENGRAAAAAGAAPPRARGRRAPGAAPPGSPGGSHPGQPVARESLFFDDDDDEISADPASYNEF